MRFVALAALAGLAHIASAVGVVGKAEGFATGVTGGAFMVVSGLWADQ